MYIIDGGERKRAETVTARPLLYVYIDIYMYVCIYIYI